MIEKYSEFLPGDPGYSFDILEPKFVKQAGLDYYSPQLLAKIQNLEENQRFMYVLINALGAQEYFSSNRNADGFPEDALKQYHQTFVEKGHVFSLHQNKDPRKKLGDILYSHYNPKMHRVELVCALDREIPAALKTIQKIESGGYVATSMGSRVPYDTCSICANRAKTRADYCQHLKEQPNKILEDGRKVFAINDKPQFFDISIVVIPADRTSGVMVSQLDKLAAMIKRTPASIPQEIKKDSILK